MESFGELLAINDGDIDTFVKDIHSANNSRASAQRILISNNVTQGLSAMLFELKDRELCNALPYEVAICGINADQIIIMRKKIAEAKEYLNRR